MGHQETIATFAAAQGRSVDEVLAAARRADVVAWSAHTPLDDREVAAITAALAAGPVSLPPPPPPVVPVSVGAAATRRSMLPLAGAAAALVLLLGIGAVVVAAGGDGGDGDDPTAASSDRGGDDAEGAGSDEDGGSCVDVLVDAVNRLDLDDIDSSDGLDDEERADLERQMTAAQEDLPELAADGGCDDVLDDPDAAEEFAARVDPEAIDALGAMATTRFEQIGDAIPGGDGQVVAPIAPAVDRAACIASFAEQINAIDLGDVDPTDGFSQAELDDITDQRFEFARLHPELRPDGACSPVASSLTGEELGRLSELVLPDRRDLLVGI